MEDKFIFYTIGCPKCHILEQKLEQADVQFETCTDLEIMKAKGFRMAPMLEQISPDGESTIMDFSAALKYLRMRKQEV